MDSSFPVGPTIPLSTVSVRGSGGLVTSTGAVLSKDFSEKFSLLEPLVGGHDVAGVSGDVMRGRPTLVSAPVTSSEGGPLSPLAAARGT